MSPFDSSDSFWRVISAAAAAVVVVVMVCVMNKEIELGETSSSLAISGF